MGGSTPELEGRKFDRFEQNHIVDTSQPVSLGQAAPRSGDKEQRSEDFVHPRLRNKKEQ